MSYSKRVYDTALKGIPELAFNNTYDVDFVSAHARQTRDTLYTRCLEVQRRMCGINVLAGTMKEFKQNAQLAQVFSLPITTYFKPIQNKFLHFFTEKETLYTIPLKEDPITNPTSEDSALGYPFSPYFANTPLRMGLKYDHFSLFEVCRDHTKFRRKLLFFIQNPDTLEENHETFLFMDLLVIPTKSRTYLAILESNTEGISKSFLEKLVRSESHWYLYETKAGNYWKDSNYDMASNIHTVGDTAYFDHAFTDNSGANKVLGMNAYLIATIHDAINSKLYRITYATYQSAVDTGDNQHPAGYAVPAAYANGIVTNDIIILNEPELTYSVDVDTIIHPELPYQNLIGYFQLPLLDNPIPPENLLVFRIDEEKGMLYPLPSSNMTLWFPNVYRVYHPEPSLVQAKIKVFAYYAKDATTKFTNPIANYLNYRGDQYINDCINGTLSAPIVNYFPYPYTYSIEDYQNSKYYPMDKPYQYIMDKDIWMLLDDPNRYTSLFRKVVKQLTNHNTYQYEISVKDTDLINRSVMNNHGQIHNESKHMDFSEPMTYLTINSRTDEMLPVMLFVDGYRIAKPHRFVEGFTQYLYFPQKMLNRNYVDTPEHVPSGNPEVYVTSPFEYIVGIPTEFTVSTEKGDYSGGNVKAYFDILSGSEFIDKIEYYETTPGMEGWYVFTGNTFGPSTGFPLMDLTSKFRLTTTSSGVITAKIRIVEIDTESEVCTTGYSFTSRQEPEYAMLTVEIMDVKSSDAVNGELRFSAVGEDIPFPETFEHFADQNLLYYFKDTKKIIPNSVFSYGIFVDIDKDHILTKDLEYLKTSNDEFVITGSHINLTSNVGHKNDTDGFYKNIGTRLSVQNIDLSGTTIYDTSYTDNSTIIQSPEFHHTWEEEMLCFDISAYEAFYPCTLTVDETTVPSNEIYRYFQYDITDQKTKEYVFFPKKYATATSKLVLTTMIASKWELLKDKVTFGETGQIRIFLNEESFLDNGAQESLINRDICAVATDVYLSKEFNTEENSFEFSSNFTGEPNINRFRIWKLEDDSIVGKAIATDLSDFSLESSQVYGSSCTIVCNNDGLKSSVDGKYHFLIEYLPYKSTVCAIHQDMSDNTYHVINLYNEVDRPLDFDYYELYVNGIRLNSNMYRAITPTHIALKDIPTTEKLVVIEKSHDQDVYGNRYRKMTLEEQLMYTDDAFKDYMMTKIFH